MAMICKNCGTVSDGRRALPGSGWIELVLWLCYLVPGLIYSIWRRGGKPTCAACGSRDLVATSTPIGAQLVEQHHPRGAPPAVATPPAAKRHVSPTVIVMLLLAVGAFALYRAG